MLNEGPEWGCEGLPQFSFALKGTNRISNKLDAKPTGGMFLWSLMLSVQLNKIRPRDKNIIARLSNCSELFPKDSKFLVTEKNLSRIYNHKRGTANL